MAKKRITVTIEEEAYKNLKEYAKQSRRSTATEMAMILEYYKPGLIPGITAMPYQTAPGVYVPTQVPTPATPQPQPQIIDISSLKGLQKEEYARKLMAEAKTEKAELKEEARVQARTLSPEEEQLEQQKLEIQKQKIQEKRDKLLRDKAIELDLWDAENYNEERVLYQAFPGDYVNAKFDEEEKGIPNPYINRPIEELYEHMKDIKKEEDERQAELDRRDALPHDAHNYDYKSEDFERDVKRLQEIYLEDYAYADPSYEEEDYKILYNYYFKTREYEDFEQKMNHPDYAFDEDDIKLLQSIFNRNNIDLDYINSLMCGKGSYYRKEHNNMKSYFEQHQEERAEWQRIIDESKRAKENDNT